MADVVEITDQSFDAEVAKSDLPVVIDFWAEWCGPCRAIAPIVKDLAAQYAGKVKIVKMDVDANPHTPAKYGIRAIPTLLAFKGGTVVEQMQGNRPKAAIEEMVKKLL